MSDQPSPQQLGRKTITGTFWVYTAVYSGKVMVFLSTIVLARLLEKEDFGIAGFALVVIAFLEVFYDLGIGQALIVHPNDRLTSSTAFWLGLGFSAILFGATWLAAPWIGALFNDPRAIPVTRVLAFTFPISALGNVHNVLMSKELRFRGKFIPEFARALSKGLISILLAFLGLGAWSLIIGQLASTAVAVIVFWIVYPWRPSLVFSLERARQVLGFGLNIVAVNSLSVIQGSAPSFLIGRYLGAGMLGVYQLAFRVPDLLISQFCSILSRVIFPVYATLKEDAATLRSAFLTATRYISLITVPIGLGIFLIAEPFVLTLFSDRWREAIPAVRAIGLYSLLFSLSYAAGDVYKATGRPHILTRLTLVEVAIELPVLTWATLTFRSVTAVAWTLTLLTAGATLLELGVAAWALKSRPLTILKALLPSFSAGGIMALAVSALVPLVADISALAQLTLCVVAGATAYLSALLILQRPMVLETIAMLRAILSKRLNRSVENP